MLEIFQFPFMQKAMLAGLLVGGLASYFGVFVVQRGLSFLGNGLAHAAFGGVALGLLLDTEPLWVAIPFTVFVAIGINWVRDRTDLAGDTSIGIFFSVSMALGIIFLALKEDYAADAFSYLFGSILSVASSDLVVIGILAFLLLLTLPLWNRWAYATYDRELAMADRIGVRWQDYLLSILIALTIVVSIKMVGIVLIAAFLVIPAAAARLVSVTFAGMTLLSVAIGISSTFAGLLASFYMDLPSGPVIILTQAALFSLAFLFK